MSDAPRGPGWWRASDGRYYPPEDHPSYQPPAPPPSPQQPPPTYYQPAKRKGGGTVWKVALGIVLGFFVLIVACTALIGGAAKKVTDDADRAGVVRIETAENVCWHVTLTGTEDGVGQNQQEHCGTKTLDMPKGLGANVLVQKRTPGSADLTAVVVIGDEETARQSTNAEFGIVTVSR